MKAKRVFKSILSLVCTTLLVLGAVFVPAVSGAENEPISNLITFENYPYKAPTGNPSLNTVTIEENDGVGMDDNFALHFKLDTDDSYQDANGATVTAGSRIAQREHCAVIGSVTSGNIYRVTYYYKTTAETTARYNIFLSTASPTSIWGSTYAKIASTEQQVAKGETDWTKVTTIFTAAPVNDKANGLYIHFTFSTSGKNNMADAYVDNVTVEEFAGSVILFHSNTEGIDDVIVSGNEGETISFPTMTNGRKPLLGWYVDAECTTPFTATTFTGGITHAYALWGDGPLTFEDYPYNTVAGGSFGRTMSIVNEEKIGNDDDYALRFRFDGSEVYSVTQEPVKDENGNEVKDENGNVKTQEVTTYMSSRAAMRDHIATLGKVKNNAVYRVSYYIRSGENCETAYSTVLATAHKDNIWASYTRYDDTRVYYTAEDKEWTKVTVYFQANLPKADGDTLFIMFNSSNATQSAFAEAYFDYVEIEELSGSVIFFHPNVGVMEDAVINGETGSTFEYPKFKNGISEITGWYTDEACTVPFVGNTFPEGITHLYAKWNNAPLTFKDYPYNTVAGGSFGRTMSIVNEEKIGNNDDYALRFRFDGSEVYSVTQEPVKDEKGNEVKDENGNVKTQEVTTYMSSRAAMRDHIATLGKVKNNAVYRVSYYIRSGENCETAYSTVLATAHKDNIWASYTRYDDTRVYYTAEDKEWTKVTVYFQANLPKADGDTLFIMFNSSNATQSAFAEAYFDYVEIEELSGSVIFFHPNVGVMEDVVINGEMGSTFEYPEFKIGRSEITGWYLDKECTTSFTGNTFPEGITHIYAKWNNGPLTFEDYPYSTQSGVFGARTMSIYKNAGFGYDDDYALRFNFKGNDIYSYDDSGNPLYMNTRAAQRDHIAIVGTIKKGAAYRVSYYYKSGSNCKTAYTIHLATSINSNIWGNSFTQFSSTRVSGSASTKDWTKASFIIDTSDIADNADTLYIKFNSANTTTEAYVDAFVDHFVIEEIETPFILVNANNSSELQIIQGKVGDKISLPTVTRHGYSFAGWYTDADLTKVFTTDKFVKDMAMTIYAKWTKHTSVTYDFESFDIPSHEDSGLFLREDSEQYKTSAAFSGNHVIKFDRTGEFNANSSWMPVADGNEIFTVERGKKYAVSISYYVAKEADEKKDMTIRLKTAASNNYWGSSYAFEQKNVISSTTKEGRWNNLLFLIDTTESKENGTSLYVIVQGGKGSIVYFDDVVITEVPSGYGVVGIQKENCTNISPFVMGKIGTNYYSKLNQKAKVSGKYFKGYFALSNGAWEALDKEKTVFTKELITLSARFIDYKMIQDFEGVYHKNSLEWESYTFYDFDYEIYDSNAEGNSKDNVTSGRYSLHRKGDSMYFENASVLTWGEEIAEGERYTVTFKVKMGKHAHTDGAIKIASGKSFRYQWATSGSYYPVVAIEDLTDGNWHEVSYTFNSVEAYVAIQTPGHVELFFDDIEFKLVDDITPLSFPVNYTEYVPAELDEAGNLIYDNAYAIDVSTIIDESLYQKDGFFGSVMMYIIIGIAAVIIIGGAVVLLILKKKKAKA